MEASLEIYLVVDNARSQALTRAWDRYDDAQVAAVDLYFRPSTDVALVAVRLRSRRDRGRWIGVVVASGVSVIDPARMAEGDRRAFFATYLQSYDVVARDCPNVAGAMTALRWHTAANKSARGTGPEKVIGEGTPPGVAASVSAPSAPLAADQTAPTPAAELPTAPTRMGSPHPATLPASPPVPTVPRMPTLGRETSLGVGRLRRPDPRPDDRVQSHAAITEPVPLPPPPDAAGAAPDPGASAVGGAPHRFASPAAGDRDDLGRAVPVLADDDAYLSRANPIDARARSPRETEPLPPPPPAPMTDTPAVTVRFLRGGQWAPARLRSLSARGAYLVTGAPPRVGDEVHVALDYGELSTLVRGSVYHVTTARDAASTGSSGFAVRFPLEATPGRQRLIELLQRARAQGVVIKPPPSRNAVRFPVRWPVELRGPHSCHADALDVSAGGMFISAATPLGGATITAVVPIDVGDPPIEVRLRVARSVTPGDAISRGLSAGYGLEIVEMSDGDRVRWTRFLSRIERRSGRSVLVGASPQRLEAIARALGDAGYAVTSSADPGTLIRLADAGQLPDVAVIDDSLLERGVSATWLEQMFTARQVPCITVHGDAQRARLVVDRLLAVSA